MNLRSFKTGSFGERDRIHALGILRHRLYIDVIMEGEVLRSYLKPESCHSRPILALHLRGAVMKPIGVATRPRNYYASLKATWGRTHACGCALIQVSKQNGQDGIDLIRMVKGSFLMTYLTKTSYRTIGVLISYMIVNRLISS